MKVLLVKPNNLSDHIQPSLGLGFLAEGIRARHEVIILDCIKEDIGPTQFVQRVLKDCRPDLVGIQCYTFDLGNARKLLKAIKEWNPDIIAVVGGAHISSDPTRAFVNLEASLDFAFAGEAEEGFPKFIDMLDAAYTPPGIKREELLVIRKKAFLKFYLRPRVLIRNLLSIKNFRHFKFLFKRFYSWIIVKNHHSTDFVVHHEPSSPAPVSLATLK